MFKFTYILLFFALTNAKAEEPTLVWQKDNYGKIQSMYFLNDTTLLLNGNNFGGVTFFINPETGESFDTIFHGINVVDFTRISPNGKIIAFCNKDRVVLFNLESKVLIKEYNSNIDISFKDDENIYVFYDYGIYKINIITDETELIWLSEDYQFPQYNRISLNKNSRFSQNGKYAVPITLGARYINLETKELLTGWRLGGDKYYPVFNPVRPNELIVVGEYLDGHNYKYAITIVDMNVPGEIKGRINLEDEIIGHYYATCSEDGKYYAIYYLGWIRIYDLETYELKSKVYLSGLHFNIYDNFIFLYSGVINKVDLNSFLSVIEKNNRYLKIFPNPSDGQLSVDINLLKSDQYVLKILNFLGQEVFFNELGFIAKGKKSFNFELNLPNGTYQVLITNDKEINYNSKFIILK
jgi:hypothetical protein